MNLRNKITHLLFALFIWSGLSAQTYPVQVFVQVTPPHTSYLPDYANPTNAQMKVFLTLTDMTVPAYDVKLRFKFQGNGYSIENPTYLNLPPITITPGVPYELSGAALAGYLNSQNLVFSGVDVTDYENRKVLPEGPCSICVEIYDYNSPTQSLLGNPACTSVWFSMYDPPYLNTPFCGTELTTSDPQQIVFGWTPLNMNSPFSVANTEYVFELFQKYPSGADANVVVNSTLPIFMQVTNQPFINYGITEPQLQIGKEYVWRVQVRDNSGRDYFKNNGYSQVCEFTYGNLTTSLFENITFNLQANGTGVRQGYAWWTASGVFQDYELEVRKTGNSSNNWFPYTTANPNTKVNSLEPETQYECRVRGKANGEVSDWSEIVNFTTQVAPNYECGTTVLPATMPNIIPYENAIKGMVFSIGQFEMLITSITPLNTPGHYVGAGKISIPFMLISLNVSFEDILVDENLTVRSGKIEAISKGMAAWEQDIEIDKAKLNPTHIAGAIDSVYMQSDSTFLVQFGDQQLIIDSIPAMVFDDQGNTYYILADGTVVYEFSGTISLDTLAASDTLQVVFKHYDQQNYGFDGFADGLWIDSYETIILGDESNYTVPYKSILKNGTDKVRAVIRAKHGETLDGLFFECLDHRGLTHTVINDSTFEIDLDGFYAEAEAIYAMWNGGKMGKLNIKAYDSIVNEVVLVPVNGTSIGNQANIQNLLNLTYQQVVVNWTVTLDSNFTNSTWDSDGNGTLQQTEDVTLMSKYSGEMKALRDAYLDAHPDFDKSKYLLFVVSGFDDSGIAGYMVRGKGVGFLAQNPTAKTIAHELGHGAFGLYHTFPDVIQGNTTNLMDYVSLARLTKYQWEEIHNWSPTLSFLDDEEDGESATVHLNMNELDKFINPDDSSFTFYTPAGKPITLWGNLTELTFATFEDKWSYKGESIENSNLPIGSLISFTLNGVKWNAKKEHGATLFNGYKNENNEYFEESISFIQNITHTPLLGIPYYDVNGFKLSIFQSNSVVITTNIDSLNKGDGALLTSNDLVQYFSDNLSESILFEPGFSVDFSENTMLVLSSISFFTKGTSVEWGNFEYKDYYTEDLGVSISNSNLPEVKWDSPYFGENALLIYRAAYFIENGASCYSQLMSMPSEYARGKVSDYLINAISSVDELYLLDPPMGAGKHIIPSNYNSHQDFLGTRNWFVISHLTAINNILEKATNSGTSNIMSELESDVIIDILDSIRKSTAGNLGQKCFLENISTETRVSLVKRVYENGSYTNDSKEELVVRILENITLEGFNSLYTEMEANNCSLLNQMRGDIWWGQLDRLSNAISYNIYQTAISNNIDFDTLPIFKVVHDGVSLWDGEVEIAIDGCEMIFTGQYFGNGIQTLRTRADALIKIHIDDSFNYLYNYETGAPISIGDTIIAPAYWLAHFLQEEADATNFIVPRIAGEIALICFFPSSATWVYNLEVGILAIDFVLSVAQDEVNNETLDEVKYAFDMLAGVVAFGQLGKWIVTAAPDMGNRIIFKYYIKKHKLDEVGRLIKQENAPFSEVISKIDDALAKLATSNINSPYVQSLKNHFLNAKKQLWLSKVTEEFNKGYLITKGNAVYYTTESSIGLLEPNALLKVGDLPSNGATYLNDIPINNLKIANKVNVSDIEEHLLNFTYIATRNVNSHILENTYKLLLTKQGNVVFNLDYKKSLLALLESNPSEIASVNLKNWVNTLDEVVDSEELSQLYSSIKELSNSQITRLNNALLKTDGTINNALSELIVKLSEGGTNALSRIAKASFKDASGTHLLTRLAEDLENNIDFKNLIVAHPNRLDSWDFVRTAINNSTNNGFTEFALDVSVLNKVSNMMEIGSVFRSSVLQKGLNWENVLKDVLFSSKVNPCINCDEPVGMSLGRSLMHDHLDNVEYYYANFNDNVFNNWARGKSASGNLLPPNSMDEMNMTLSLLKNDNITNAALGVEYPIHFSSTSHKSDIFVLGTGDLYELKNAILNNELSTQYRGQLLDMLANIDDINNAFWVSKFLKNKDKSFNIINGVNSYIEVASDLNEFKDALKHLWQKAFSEYSDDFFDVIWNNSSLKGQLFNSSDEVSAYSEFESLVNSTNSILYSFIKVVE